MPMNTMLVTRRPASPVPVASRVGIWPTQSPSASRATTSCAAISAAERLRTRRCVPVWQNEQVSVQPTWLETQSVPRSGPGM